MVSYWSQLIQAGFILVSDGFILVSGGSIFVPVDSMGSYSFHNGFRWFHIGPS